MLDPVASSGLDRGLRQSLRVPVGRGFAGKIAQTRRPMALAEVTDDNVVDPMLLRRYGIRSLLGVPLHAGGDLLGVVYVGSRSARVFTEHDTRALISDAASLATVIESRLRVERHTAALVLQRSLLPTLTARRAGLDIAARYIPAEGDLGGDWYDVSTRTASGRPPRSTYPSVHRCACSPTGSSSGDRLPSPPPTSQALDSRGFRPRCD